MSPGSEWYESTKKDLVESPLSIEILRSRLSSYLCTSAGCNQCRGAERAYREEIERLGTPIIIAELVL